MAKKSTVLEKQDEQTANKGKPFFANPTPQLEVFQLDRIHVGVSGEKVVMNWDEDIHSEVNYLDEDLNILIYDPKGERLIRDERVNFLVDKELNLEAGQDYLVQFAVKEKFMVNVATTSETSPKISLIPEGIDRYMITWGQLEWEHIRREVVREHQVDWDNEIEVVLKIIRRRLTPWLHSKNGVSPE
jgi:hypothetical protein